MSNLRIRSLAVSYGRRGDTAVPIDNLDLDLSSGELVLLLGPSGCGKTTLISCLAGMLTPMRGSIEFGSLEITQLHGAARTAYRRRMCGTVFQSINLIPSLTALENVEVPMRCAGMGSREARIRAAELLRRVHVCDQAGQRPGSLSGGQQQRVAIARALGCDPPLLLADEPTAHLDDVQADGVIRILRDLARPGRLVVVATHDERLLPFADRVVRLAGSGRATVGAPRPLPAARWDATGRRRPRLAVAAAAAGVVAALAGAGAFAHAAPWAALRSNDSVAMADGQDQGLPGVSIARAPVAPSVATPAVAARTPPPSTAPPAAVVASVPHAAPSARASAAASRPPAPPLVAVTVGAPLPALPAPVPTLVPFIAHTLTAVADSSQQAVVAWVDQAAKPMQIGYSSWQILCGVGGITGMDLYQGMVLLGHIGPSQGCGTQTSPTFSPSAGQPATYRLIVHTSLPRLLITIEVTELR